MEGCETGVFILVGGFVLACLAIGAGIAYLLYLAV